MPETLSHGQPAKMDLLGRHQVVQGKLLDLSTWHKEGIDAGLKPREVGRAQVGDHCDDANGNLPVAEDILEALDNHVVDQGVHRQDQVHTRANDPRELREHGRPVVVPHEGENLGIPEAAGAPLHVEEGLVDRRVIPERLIRFGHVAPGPGRARADEVRQGHLDVITILPRQRSFQSACRSEVPPTRVGIVDDDLSRGAEGPRTGHINSLHRRVGVALVVVIGEKPIGHGVEGCRQPGKCVTQHGTRHGPVVAKQSAQIPNPCLACCLKSLWANVPTAAHVRHVRRSAPWIGHGTGGTAELMTEALTREEEQEVTLSGLLSPLIIVGILSRR
mmetsp:Transcript_47890/g.137414  ORF Transcript_47890/g.137414 Transcript_47890/m.137414 type:complete len:332 (-) Transcript_47890:656-1651(-)